MRRYQPLVLALLAGFLSSCHKDDPAPTSTQLLTGRKWQVTSSIIEAPGQPTVDLYALTAPYTRDNFEQFNTPDSYTLDEGPTKYQSTDSQTQLGTWTLNSSNMQLVVTRNGSNSTFTIEELTTTAFKRRATLLQSNGTTATITTVLAAL